MTNSSPAPAICGTCYGNYRPAERHDCTDPAQTGYGEKTAPRTHGRRDQPALMCEAGQILCKLHSLACDGGSVGCTGLVRDPGHAESARHGDLWNFPYCPPCRVAAHADSVLDEPEQGPRTLAPSWAALRVDEILETSRVKNADAGQDWTIWLAAEYRIRQGIQGALVGLPTGGGTRRDEIGERIANWAACLPELTRRITDGTVWDRLYQSPEDEEW